MKLIPLDAVLAEIESLEDKGKYHEEYDCAYRDGNNSALYALKGRIDALEVKEVDLEGEIKEVQRDYKTIDEYEGYFATIYASDIEWIAKHFFELGLLVNNPITAADRGMAEEIIINLKMLEKDYRIVLTREIEWLRNQVQKEEKV